MLGHGIPQRRYALSVKAAKPGALAPPVSYTFLWNDRGSGADSDVTLYKMNAPWGYTCLGDIAVNSYYVKPDLGLYRCVKNEYLVQGRIFQQIWKDNGSGADLDGSVWEVSKTLLDVDGIDGSHFVANGNWQQPSRSVMLLRGNNNRVQSAWSVPKTEEFPLNVYEVHDFNLVWTDRGSGGRYDVSIWRPQTTETQVCTLWNTQKNV